MMHYVTMSEEATGALHPRVYSHLVVCDCNALFTLEAASSVNLNQFEINPTVALCVGVSRGYTDYHQGRAIHMADSRIH